MPLDIDLKSLLGRSTTASAAPVKIAPPRVDLLPSRYRRRARERTIRFASYGALAACGLATVGGFGLAANERSQAQEDHAAAQVVNSDLSRELAVYAPVTNLARQTRALTETVQAQTSITVDHAAVVDKFLQAAQGHMDVTSVSLDTSDGSGCVSTDPFGGTTAAAGCLSFSGQADDVSGLLVSLGGEPWFSDPYVPSLGGDSVSGTVTVTLAARTPEQDDASGAIPTTDEPASEPNQDGDKS